MRGICAQALGPRRDAHSGRPQGASSKGCSYEGVGLWEEVATPWRDGQMAPTPALACTLTLALAGRADGGPALQDTRRDTLRPHRRGVVQDAHGGRREERQEAGAEDHLGRPVDLAQRLQVQAALRPAQGGGALAAHDVLDAQGEQRAQGHHRPVRRPLRLRGAPLLRLESLRLPQAAGARAHPHPSP